MNISQDTVNKFILFYTVYSSLFFILKKLGSSLQFLNWNFAIFLVLYVFFCFQIHRYTVLISSNFFLLNLFLLSASFLYKKFAFLLSFLLSSFFFYLPPSLVLSLPFSLFAFIFISASFQFVFYLKSFYDEFVLLRLQFSSPSVFCVVSWFRIFFLWGFY